MVNNISPAQLPLLLRSHPKEKVKHESERILEQPHAAGSAVAESHKLINFAISQVTRIFEGSANEIRISYDEMAGQVVVAILDQAENAVVLTLPTKEFLTVARRVGKQGGLIGEIA